MFRCSYPVHMMERWGDEPKLVRTIYSSNDLQGIKLDYALARCIESSFDVVYLDFGPSLNLDSIRVMLNGAIEWWSPTTDRKQALRFLLVDSAEMDIPKCLELLRGVVRKTYPDGVDLVSLKSPAD